MPQLVAVSFSDKKEDRAEWKEKTVAKQQTEEDPDEDTKCVIPLFDARPASPTLLDNTGHPAPDHPTQVIPGTGEMIGGGNNTTQYQYLMQQKQPQQHDYDAQQYQQQTQQQPPPVSQHSGGGLFSGATSLLSGATQAATGGLFGSKPKTDQNLQPNAAQSTHQQQQGFGGIFGGVNQQQQQPQNQQQPQQHNQQQQGQGPGFMSKLNEMAAPGSDILSKAKDSIFGKFGFGK